jgi:hypothetical protein
MDVEQFRINIVQPVLKFMDMGGLDAEELLIGTAVQESGGLRYVRQLGGGPALSFFQIEPATHQDIHKNYLAYRPELLQQVNRLRFDAFQGHEVELMGNMAYSVAIARLVYRRVRAPLPNKDNVMEMAKYWKMNYNTLKGKGTVGEFVENYKRYVNKGV